LLTSVVGTHFNWDGELKTTIGKSIKRLADLDQSHTNNLVYSTTRAKACFPFMQNLSHGQYA